MGDGADATEDGGPSWPKPKMEVDAAAAARMTEDGRASLPKHNDVYAVESYDYGGL
jgi:hypothetical protein